MSNEVQAAEMANLRSGTAMAIEIRLTAGPGAAADYGGALPRASAGRPASAASAIASRGRRRAEAECRTRSPFQRDRDRVLHATPFRRLTHKDPRCSSITRATITGPA